MNFVETEIENKNRYYTLYIGNHPYKIIAYGFHKIVIDDPYYTKRVVVIKDTRLITTNKQTLFSYVSKHFDLPYYKPSFVKNKVKLIEETEIN